MALLPDDLSQIYVLLILLPGFITFFVERALVYQNPCQAAELVAKSLVYSLLVFVAVYGLDAVLLHGQLSPLWVQVSYVLAASILGLLIGLLKTHGGYMKLAQRLKLTKRTPHVSTWLDVFHQYYPPQTRIGPYVTVTLKDGRQVMGYPTFFSDDYHDGPVLFLVEARWLADETRIEVPPPGILLCGASIECVQFQGDEADKTRKREMKRIREVKA